MNAPPNKPLAAWPLSVAADGQSLIPLSLGEAEIRTIARRLGAIYKRSRYLELEAAKEKAGSKGMLRSAKLPILSFAEIADRPLQSRLQCVNGPISGLAYAAWCMGLVLMQAGGMPLMYAVLGEFEKLFEESEVGRASSWLDHRWDGVSDASGAVWCS